MKLTESLVKLGLSQKAAAVYLAGLELGTASVQALAIKTKIKRTTIYLVMEELQTFGLVTETVAGKKRKFVFAHPNQLKVLENEREQTLEQSFPELQRLAAESPGQPQVTYADSLEQIQKLYEVALKTAESDTIGTGDATTADRLDKKWLQGYIAKRKQKGLKSKVLLADSKEARQWFKQNQTDQRDIALVEGVKLPINIEVIGDIVLITSLDGETMALSIESKKVATGFRQLLEELWRRID